MTSTWRALALVLLAALVAAGCSSGDDDDSAGEAAAASTTTAVDALGQVVLPGQPGAPASTTTQPAGGPATSAAPGAVSTSTTGAPAPTSAPTSAPAPTTTTSAPPAGASTTTTAPARGGLPFGPTVLVDAGESASTFQWEMATVAPDSQSNVSVEWLIDGTSESMTLVDDDFDEILVRIGAQHWATNQAGDTVPTDAATFGQRRQSYLNETFATSIGMVMSPSELDGPGRYVIATDDQAVIGAVLGGLPLAGSSMRGTIDVDTAGRVVGWTLDVTQPAPAGQATPTTFSLTGSILAGVTTPITPPA
jgi:hypothetical protein